MPEPILEPGDICTCSGFTDSQVFIGWSVLFWEHLLWCTLTLERSSSWRLQLVLLYRILRSPLKRSQRFHANFYINQVNSCLKLENWSIKKKCSGKETLITGESNKALLKRRRVLAPFRILLSELPNYIKFQWWSLQIVRHLLVNMADLKNVKTWNSV